MRLLYCTHCGSKIGLEEEGKLYVCSACGAKYEARRAEEAAEALAKLLDGQKQEAVANLRRQLWQKFNEEYIDGEEISRLAKEIKKYLPDDYFANFCELACGRDQRKLNKFLNKTDVQEQELYVWDVLGFMLHILREENLLAVNEFLARVREAEIDGDKYAQYNSRLQEEAKRVSRGVYDVSLPRDVFVAYSSADREEVSELVETLEGEKLKCFVAARNLQHGMVKHYEEKLKTAMDRCKTFLFVSSKNSRSRTCDALKVELSYIREKDILAAPVYRNNYEKMPPQYKKPRVEYLLDEHSGSAADDVVEEFFAGYEYCFHDAKAAAVRILKFISAGSAAVKYCAACGAENLAKVKFCSECGGRGFFATREEYEESLRKEKESERLAAEKQKAEQEAAAQKRESERLAAEKQRAEQEAAAQKRELERLAAEKQKAEEEAAAQKRELERLAAEKQKAEQEAAAQKAEQEKLKAELSRARNEAAQMRMEKEQAKLKERMRQELARREQEKQKAAAKEAERARLAAEKQKAEQEAAAQKAEQEKLKAELERLFRGAAQQEGKKDAPPADAGALYTEGRKHYDAGEYDRAVPLLKAAAEQGHADAQFNLGNCYYKGEGVKQDYAEAVSWYRKSAEQGHINAQYNLGLCYENGKGVRQDHAEAVKWYRKSAEQGNAYAQNNLGVCYKKGRGVGQDYAEAVKWYRKAAEQGNSDAQFNFGLCCANGEGVGQDYAEAVKWFKKAADQKDSDAEYSLGVCYISGKGVTKDYAEALKWFRKSAERGNKFAQYNLGACYEYSKGVKQDIAEAVKWYRKAAEQGDKEAQGALARLTEKEAPVKKPAQSASSARATAPSPGSAAPSPSPAKDFEIKDGVLVNYKGKGGDVVIPQGVTSIGDSAFWGCSSLTSVTLPATVQTIEEEAFKYCDKVKLYCRRKKPLFWPKGWDKSLKDKIVWGK